MDLETIKKDMSIKDVDTSKALEGFGTIDTEKKIKQILGE